jgi:hypothetical protein
MAKWIEHILGKNFLLRPFIERKIGENLEGKIERKGGRGKRC